MPRMTGGEAIVDSLVRHGIDTVFGLPGVQTYGLFDAFARASNSLRLINARHEQTTAYMALGYACATGRPAAYAVVPGPGVLNTTAALATAWGVNAPVLCLTGQVPSMMIGRGRGQLHELPDQLATLRSLLKWAERIEHPSQASYLTARAFQEMLSGRQGPVALEMPWDQFGASAEITPQDPLPRHPKPLPDPERIAALAKLLNEAKAPMLWVGGGALHAATEIRALAERINAPVVSFRSGRGIVDDRHPLGLTIASAYRLWPQTDLLVAFGTRLEVPMSRWGAAPAGLKVARIDIDPAEMRRLRADVPIVADSADAARALAAVVAPRSDTARAELIARTKAETAQTIQKVQPQMSFLEAIRDVLPENGILCDEMTQAGYVSWFGFPIHAPRTLITSGFSGTLGAGFPTALGVKVAMPDRPGGGADRRRRLPVRRRGTRDRDAVRHQPGDGAVQQLILRQRPARPAPAVRGPRFRLEAAQSGLPDLRQELWRAVLACSGRGGAARRTARGAGRECAGVDRGDDRHHPGIRAVGVHRARARVTAPSPRPATHCRFAWPRPLERPPRARQYQPQPGTSPPSWPPCPNIGDPPSRLILWTCAPHWATL